MARSVSFFPLKHHPIKRFHWWVYSPSSIFFDFILFFLFATVVLIWNHPTSMITPYRLLLLHANVRLQGQHLYPALNHTQCLEPHWTQGRFWANEWKPPPNTVTHRELWQSANEACFKPLSFKKNPNPLLNIPRSQMLGIRVQMLTLTWRAHLDFRFQRLWDWSWSGKAGSWRLCAKGGL